MFDKHVKNDDRDGDDGDDCDGPSLMVMIGCNVCRKLELDEDR